MNSQDQYLKAKADYPNALVLFRVGDFYEAFSDDCTIIAKELGLTITTRTDANKILPTAFPPDR